MICKLFSIIIILSLLIFIAPASFADDASYGAVTGKVLDRNGNPLGNATVDLRDWTEETIQSTTSAGDGTFVFDHIPIAGPGGWNSFSLRATYNTSGNSYSDKTEFFRIYANQLASHNAIITFYPPSGYGWLTGKVVNADNIKLYLSAIIYLNNGMYYFVSGEPGDNWQFYLPEGDYQVWAEHYENGKIYSSGKSDVHVRGDDTNTAVLMVSLQNSTDYHAPPAPGINIVHGKILQRNNDPLDGARVELCRLTGSSFDPVMATTSSVDGSFEFKDVNTSTPMENYVARIVYDFNGKDYTKVSDPFTIYYKNTLGVSHDYQVQMSVDFVDSGSAELISDPPGARIWIDGVDTGRNTPFNLTGLKVGDHQGSLLMDGYLPENMTVSVLSEKTTRVNKILKPSTGDVLFKVKPSDASVYLNGAFIGKGSMNMTKLQYGEYSYMVSQDGYRNITGTFIVIPGEHLDIPVELVAVPGLSLTYFGYLIDSVLSSIGNIF